MLIAADGVSADIVRIGIEVLIGPFILALGLALNDRIHVEFAPQNDPKLSDNRVGGGF